MTVQDMWAWLNEAAKNGNSQPDVIYNALKANGWKWPSSWGAIPAGQQSQVNDMLYFMKDYDNSSNQENIFSTTGTSKNATVWLSWVAQNGNATPDQILAGIRNAGWKWPESWGPPPVNASTMINTLKVAGTAKPDMPTTSTPIEPGEQIVGAPAPTQGEPISLPPVPTTRDHWENWVGQQAQRLNMSWEDFFTKLVSSQFVWDSRWGEPPPEAKAYLEYMRNEVDTSPPSVDQVEPDTVIDTRDPDTGEAGPLSPAPPPTDPNSPPTDNQPEPEPEPPPPPPAYTTPDRNVAGPDWWKDWQYGDSSVYPDLRYYEWANWFIPYMTGSQGAHVANQMAEKEAETPGTLPTIDPETDGDSGLGVGGYGSATGAVETMNSWLKKAQQLTNAATPEGRDDEWATAFGTLQDWMKSAKVDNHMNVQQQADFQQNYESWMNDQSDDELKSIAQNLLAPNLRSASYGSLAKNGRPVMGGSYQVNPWVVAGRVSNPWFVS